ncbi:MAG TPA: D-alanine--D-alanine ligase family protein [Thermoanaerobaculia bacterium]|nr:D-alanine--D-alanine ligase family protein [Thermoanaerobaculia bacterium]
MKRLRVGVIYGGRSGEHEVSLASAAAVFAHLDRQRYEPVPIRIDKDGRWALAERAPSAMSAAEVIEHARLEAGRAPRAAREVHLMARPSEEPLLCIDREAGRGGGADRPGERKTGLDRGDGQGAVVQSMGLDVVFPVLHGPYGEDGTVQGLLELANLPYVGCGVLASAVGMDKAMMKVVFAQHGLSQVDYAVVLRSEWTRNRAGVREGLLAKLPMPLFVKPANLGSSVGISKVHDASELDAALDLAAGFDRKIVVEAGVANAREIECAVLGNDTPEASVAGEVVPSREFYDYEAKYIDEGSKTIIPADLSPAQLADVQHLSKAAFLAIDGAGLARVDFLLGRDDGRLYLNEVNTLPGFTTISMYAKLWEASGVAYPALIDRLIVLALERHTAKQQLRTSVL